MSVDRKSHRTVRAWDVALSVVLMVLSVIAGLVGSLAVLFSVAFTDYCPPDTCHPGVGFSELFTVWVVGLVLVIALWIVTIVLLVRRRRAWWVAAISLLIVVIAVVVGFLLYATAVGYF